jgi:hypothetical protein
VRAASSFVERFPRLLETSQTGLVPERLNKRHCVLIDNNRPVIAGKKILDLASHDGRWSLAALEAGAAHVTGIEARAHLVDNARANCLAYGIDPGRFRFVHGEIFTTLRHTALGPVDTVFCFGFFYHIAHHVELVALVDRLKPQTVIIDTGISPAASCSMEWSREKVDDEPNAVPDAYTRDGSALVGYPTRQAVDLMWKHYGYKVAELDWKPYFESLVGVDDYFFNKRASFLAVRGAA